MEILVKPEDEQDGIPLFQPYFDSGLDWAKICSWNSAKYAI